MKIGIFTRFLKNEDIKYVQILLKSFLEKEIDICFYKPFWEDLRKHISIISNPDTFSDKDILKIDILLALGGDGTLLNALPSIQCTNIPVLGINLGHLGFLTSVGKENIQNLADNLLRKKYSIDERTLLSIDELAADIKDYNRFALNELTIHRKDDYSLLGISLYIDGKYVTDYFGDGLIIATPTGSTAYSLSCGGPILTPDSNCFVITPIAPHTLTFRPIVIHDQSVIKLMVRQFKKDYYVSIDSQRITFESAGEITLTKADFSFKLVRMENNTFYTSIRNKLMWGESNRQ